MTAPTPGLPERVAAALAKAGIEEWHVESAFPRQVTLTDGGVEDDAEYLTVTPLVVLSYYRNGYRCRLGQCHERIVALVRSVLSGGWREAVPLHGIVPTLTNMIAETTRRKWDATLHVETDRVLWNIAEIWNEEGSEPPWGAGSEDVEEAMGQALLLALKDQKTA